MLLHSYFAIRQALLCGRVLASIIINKTVNAMQYNAISKNKLYIKKYIVPSLCPDAAHDGGRVASLYFNRKALQQVGGSMLIACVPHHSAPKLL